MSQLTGVHDFLNRITGFLVKSRTLLLTGLIAILLISKCSQENTSTKLSYIIAPDPISNVFHITMRCEGIQRDTTYLKIPAWTPGYYQIMNYGDNVSNFQPHSGNGNELAWEKINRNTWCVFSNDNSGLIINYDVKTARPFIANSFIDAGRIFITPAAIIMYIEGMLDQSVELTIDISNDSTIIASGLELTNGSSSQFTAKNFDVLYDSPILIGNLEELPLFEVKGIPHKFIGYELGDFDRVSFRTDLMKIVESSVNIIGEIPYNHYVFLAIGPGRGGLEHLNSTAFSFSGGVLNNPDGKRRMYSFLAHEYFHNYNVKRIRPIELGPFDYDKGNRTKMLWVSEGITVYYDLLIVRRAGISTTEEMLEDFRRHLVVYETQPGRLYQSLTEASWETWSDGPFGRTNDEFNKTISIYDKGALIGLMLDFNIRHATNNTKSLDDVMRTLYYEFYKEKNRGFTEAEFYSVCEQIAGTELTELFEYTTSVKPIDYQKYFAYGGLDIDVEPRPVPGAWLGISTRMRNDSLFVTSVDYESPAWKAGLRRRMIILEIDGKDLNATPLKPIMINRNPDETITLLGYHQGNEILFNVKLDTKVEPSFEIKPGDNPTNLQKAIFEDWIKK